MTSPLRFSIIALVSSSMVFSTEAQDTILVPKSGIYGSSAPGTNNLYQGDDAAGAVNLEVSNCGESVRLTAEGTNSLILTYTSGLWKGSMDFSGNTMRYELRPRSETLLQFDVIFPMGNLETSNLSLVTEAEATGNGSIHLIDVREVRESLFWVVEEADYLLNLYDFGVNDAQLLPEHHVEIDRAVDMMSGEDKAQGICEERLPPVGWDQAVGYASQTGPEHLNARLAQQRADALATAINARRAEDSGKLPYSFDLIGARRGGVGLGGLNLPNLETGCNRRAIWQFTLRRRFVDPYTIEDAKKWLREDLAGICSERGVDSPSDAQSLAEGDRRHARARYALALNYLEMLDAGHCSPSSAYDEQATYEMMNGSGSGGGEGVGGFKRAVASAYRRAASISEEDMRTGGREATRGAGWR